MPGPEAINSPVAGAPDGTRRLTWLYIIALSAVALLTLGGQWVVQWSLASQQRNSTVVNIAGRQRMLSQRLAKTALQVATATNDIEQRQLQQELDSIAADWRRAHEGLQHGDQALMLPGRNSAAAKALYTELAPYYEAMLAGVRQMPPCLLARSKFSPTNAASCRPWTTSSFNTTAKRRRISRVCNGKNAG
jgi:deoxyribodipyrimidine photolyase